MSAERHFLTDVEQEAAHAIDQVPHPGGLVDELADHTAEVARPLLDGSPSDVYREAVRVAATALRLATEGDPTLGRVREWRINEACPVD